MTKWQAHAYVNGNRVPTTARRVRVKRYHWLPNWTTRLPFFGFWQTVVTFGEPPTAGANTTVMHEVKW